MKSEETKWKNYKFEKPLESGEYLVYTGCSIRVLPCFKGVFYKRPGYSTWDTEENNAARYHGQKKAQVFFWMPIEPLPKRESKKTLSDILYMLSPKAIKLLEDNGITTLEKLLKTSKQDLYRIKRFGNHIFSRILDSLDKLELPENWGTHIELNRIARGKHHEEILKEALNIDAEDVPRYLFTLYDHKLDRIIVYCRAGFDMFEKYKVQLIKVLMTHPLYEKHEEYEYDKQELKFYFHVADEFKKSEMFKRLPKR